jgi:O-antigen/teichoic acid export membrane protein
MLLDFGVSSALPRMLPRLLAARDQIATNELLGTTIAFLLPISLVALLASPLMAHFVVQFATIPESLHEPTYWVVLINVASAALVVPLRLGFGILGALSRFDLYFGYETGGLLLKLGMAGFVLYAAPSLPWYAASIAIPTLLVGIAEFRIALRLLRPATLQLSLFRQWALRALLSMCGASLLMTFAAATTTQGGTLLVGAFGAAEEVALFAFPLILVSSAMSFAGSFGAFLAPVTNALHATKEAERVRGIVVGTVRLATALAGLIAVTVILLGPALLPVWLGQRAVSGGGLETMVDLLLIFGIGFATFVPGSALKGLLLSVGNPWTVAVTEVVVAIAAIAFAAALYLWSGLGLRGIGGAIAAGLALRGLLFLPWLSARLLDENPGRFLTTLYARPLAVVAGSTAAAFALHSLWQPPSTPALIAVLFSFSLVWLLGCYLLVLPQEVKDRVEKLWSRCFDVQRRSR